VTPADPADTVPCAGELTDSTVTVTPGGVTIDATRSSCPATSSGVVRVRSGTRRGSATEYDVVAVADSPDESVHVTVMLGAPGVLGSGSVAASVAPSATTTVAATVPLVGVQVNASAGTSDGNQNIAPAGGDVIVTVGGVATEYDVVAVADAPAVLVHVTEMVWVPSVAGNGSVAATVVPSTTTTVVATTPLFGRQ
jgi:uncharacterized protein with GYD domain